MRPETEAELAEIVAGAAGPLAIQGGGTRRIGGAEGAVLETSGLSGVVLYEPAALTLVVRAGTPLAEVEALLAGERQRLAFEPLDMRQVLGRTGVSTIGGVVAANASGPRRVQSGAARDALIGVRFVSGRGEVVKSGGRVMKNVTGYDLVKLMAGSHGTLGVLSELSFKLQAQPEVEATLILEGLDDGPGLAALRRALGSPFDVSGVARVSGRSVVRLEGLAGSVAYRVGQLRAVLPGDVSVVEGEASAEIWRNVRDLAPLQGPEGDLWRISCLPTHAAELAAAMGGTVLFDRAGGQVSMVLPEGQGEALQKALAGRGQAILLRGAGALPFARSSAEVLALSAGLKSAFDPKALFNPAQSRGLF
ncbi:FAD-binding protein [Xinfangfangia sp. CPCC 101601]|uniref:FAD-binding protein n=1 Tax=Pseudogemmobacter lacusdianii TaxID=3069608 RepID=A0ABU0W1Y3_9RHOB|nr:FAD-binding protein [Xinfangfangia sp. CPCC 101601]MDQ2067435.1 FAD-binding protein [Xinfangfangia sp. CPCC 101601]